MPADFSEIWFQARSVNILLYLFPILILYKDVLWTVTSAVFFLHLYGRLCMFDLSLKSKI